MASPRPRQIGNGTYLYTYDPINRLVAVRNKSTNVLMAQYFYDSAGERAAAITYNASGTATAYTQYLRSGATVIDEKTWALPGYIVTEEKTYIGVGGAMAVTRQTGGGTTTYSYYATDHLGTVRCTLTTDSNGTEQSRTFHDFEPFGLEIPVKDTTSTNTHRFTGQEGDSQTGNDYMHFRFYGSVMGRFYRPDNVMGSATNPQDWNLYSYVHGNPVNLNDPTGHWCSSAPPSPPERYIPGVSWQDYEPTLDEYLWGGAASSENVVYLVISKGSSIVARTEVSANHTITVDLNLIVDSNMTPEQRSAALAKFSKQLNDANKIWGKLGIHVTAGTPTVAPILDSTGNDFNATVAAKGKINVFVTNDLSMPEDAGGKMVCAHTYAILMLQDRTGTGTLTHELGHAFGVRGRDEGGDFMLGIVAHYYYEAKLDLIIAHLRLWGSIRLAQADDLRAGASEWQ